MEKSKVYNKLLIVYLCEKYRVKLNKKIQVNPEFKKRIDENFASEKEMLDYLESINYIEKKSDTEYFIKCISDKFVANVIKNKSCDSFSKSEIVSMHLDFMVEKCCVYVEELFKKENISFKSGEVTRKTFREGLKYFSCSKMFSFINRAVKYSFEKFSSEENPSQREITQYAIRCVGYNVKKAIESKFNIRGFTYSKHSDCFELSSFFYNKILPVNMFSVTPTEVMSYLKKRNSFKYRCTGNLNSWGWVDFRQEIKGKLLDFESRGASVIYAIYETEELISDEILKKYGVSAKLL